MRVTQLDRQPQPGHSVGAEPGFERSDFLGQSEHVGTDRVDHRLTTGPFDYTLFPEHASAPLKLISEMKHAHQRRHIRLGHQRRRQRRSPEFGPRVTSLLKHRLRVRQGRRLDRTRVTHQLDHVIGPMPTTCARRLPRTTGESADLAPLRPHDLRHTAVAFWIHAGASPKEIAVRTGHSSVVTVLDRYGHLLPGTEERVTDALDEMAFTAPRKAASVTAISTAI
jgi:hypothetical protein